MKSKQAEAFGADEIVIARESLVTTLADGSEHFLHVGDRRRASDPVVRQAPWFFQADGEVIVPLARPEQPDPPPPPPREPVRWLRSRKDWRGGPYTIPGKGGMADDTFHIVLHGGRLLRADTSWLKVLDKRQMRELFEPAGEVGGGEPAPPGRTKTLHDLGDLSDPEPLRWPVKGTDF